MSVLLAAGSALLLTSTPRPQMEVCEVEQIRTAWDLVAAEKAHHGVEIFIRMFDKYPELKGKFARLPNDPEVMRKSARMRAHATRVVVSFGSIIEQLDDTELVDESIMLLGDSHNKRRVVTEDFQKFSGVLLDYLKEALGDKLSLEGSAAYSKLTTVFVGKMSQHLDD